MSFANGRRGTRRAPRPAHGRGPAEKTVRSAGAGPPTVPSQSVHRFGEELDRIERQIYALEDNFLQDTVATGNAVAGYDKFRDACVAAGPQRGAAAAPRAQPLPQPRSDKRLQEQRRAGGGREGPHIFRKLGHGRPRSPALVGLCDSAALLPPARPVPARPPSMPAVGEPRMPVATARDPWPCQKSPTDTASISGSMLFTAVHHLLRVAWSVL